MISRFSTSISSNNKTAKVMAATLIKTPGVTKRTVVTVMVTNNRVANSSSIKSTKAISSTRAIDGTYV